MDAAFFVGAGFAAGLAVVDVAGFFAAAFAAGLAPAFVVVFADVAGFEEGFVAAGVTGVGAAFLSVDAEPRLRLKTRSRRLVFGCFFPALDSGGVR